MTDTPTPTATTTADAAAPATVSRKRRAPAMFAPLRYRDYRLLFTGQLISSIGNTFYSVALPWYMLTQGGGPINLGLVLTAYGVPLGVTTLLGGWLSDKLRARRVMLIADAACAVVTGGLAWATFGAHTPLWVIAALTAAMGAFAGPVRSRVAGHRARPPARGPAPGGERPLLRADAPGADGRPLAGGLRRGAGHRIRWLRD